MRVAFLYNESSEDPALAAEEADPTRSPIIAALLRLGHKVAPIACTLDLSAARRELLRARPEVVLNRVESLGGSDAMMGAVPLLLETLQIPYTGCTGEALAATASKLVVKQRLTEAGLPTPPWVTAGCLDGCVLRISECGLQHAADNPQSAIRNPKFILKSVYEHASFQMNDSAVIDAEDAGYIAECVRQRETETNRPFFAEQFVDGREFNLSVWGNESEVLPPAEIDFSAFPVGKPHIVAHGAKWDASSFEYRHTPRRFDFSAADAPLLRRLRELTLACAQLFNLRGGYARVDFRCDADCRPWILEINSNPCLSPDAGFAAALLEAAIEFDQAIQRLLDDAIARARSQASVIGCPMSDIPSPTPDTGSKIRRGEHPRPISHRL
jgi:D-alanine-D-alanine ligase